jgi:NRPS condensation-like uncharacterized protein
LHPIPNLYSKGTYERFRAVLHDLGYHYNVSILARYSGVAITRHQLRQVLGVTIREHPALGVRLSGKDELTPRFVRLEKIDLDKMIHFSEVLPEDELDKFMSEQHSRGFDISATDLPLWRLVVFESCDDTPVTDIAFIYHHVIGDGKSGLTVHSTILRALNSHSLHTIGEPPLPPTIGGQKQHSVSSALVTTSKHSLYPSLEQILSLSISTITRVSMTLGPWFRHWLRKEDPGRWTGAPHHMETPNITKVRSIRIPALSVSRIVARCRIEQTTITPLFQILIGKAIFQTINAAEGLRCAVAISLRRFFPPNFGYDDSIMGLWVSAFHLDYARAQLLSPKKFWDQVRDGTQKVRAEIAKGDENLDSAMLQFIPDFRAALLDKIGQKRENSFSITNLGIFDGDPPSQSEMAGEERLRISDLTFSQSAHVNGSALNFCIASAKEGGMTVAITWQEGTVSVEDVERVAEALRRDLLEVAE